MHVRQRHGASPEDLEPGRVIHPFVLYQRTKFAELAELHDDPNLWGVAWYRRWHPEPTRDCDNVWMPQLLFHAREEQHSNGRV